MKIPVEFIPDYAAWTWPTFPHRKPSPPMLDGRPLALVVDVGCLIQIAAGKQQAHPLLSNAHAVELNLRPRSLGGSAKDAVGVQHYQCRLTISIANTRSDDLLPTVCVEISQRKEVQMPRVPVLRNRVTVGIDDSYLMGILRYVITRDHDSGALVKCWLQHPKCYRPVGRRIPRQLWQFSSRCPPPSLFALIAVTDQRRRARNRVDRG